MAGEVPDPEMEAVWLLAEAALHGRNTLRELLLQRLEVALRRKAVLLRELARLRLNVRRLQRYETYLLRDIEWSEQLASPQERERQQGRLSDVRVVREDTEARVAALAPEIEQLQALSGSLIDTVRTAMGRMCEGRGGTGLGTGEP